MMTDLTFPTLYALRDQLAGINRQIHARLADLKRIRSAPAHADDIADQFRRGIDDAASAFEARLATYFSDPHAGDTPLIASDGLALYLMRDLAAAMAPDLIKRLCPSAERGMPSSERQRLLQEANGHLDRLATALDGVRQAFGKEKWELSQQRQAAKHARNDKATYAIEREERTLVADLDAISAAQNELQRLRSNGSGPA